MFRVVLLTCVALIALVVSQEIQLPPPAAWTTRLNATNYKSAEINLPPTSWPTWLVESTPSIQEECAIELNKEIPLILNDEGKFLYAKDKDKQAIDVDDKSDVYVDCPGGVLYSYYRTPIRPGVYKCDASQKSFVSDFPSVLGKSEFVRFGCVEPENYIQVYHKGNCLGKPTYSEADIGIKSAITNQQFIPLITVCFDTSRNIPVYTRHILSKYAQNGVGSRDNNEFFEVSYKFYRGWNLENLYSNGKNRWSRGHLTPSGDFAYKFQKNATFDYINIAPQYTEFNTRSWEQLETAIRKNVTGETPASDAEIFTGIFGVALEKSKKIEFNDGEKEHTIQVPKWFWKVVKSPKLKDYVFLGFNNPLVSNGKKGADSAFKNEICDGKLLAIKSILNDIKYNVDTLKNGLLYVCKISNLKGNFSKMIKKLK